MRIAIVGSRSYPAPQRVAYFVRALAPDTIIVSGGAHGPDAWAAHCGEVFGLPEPIIHKADWGKHGRSAGYIRNPLIVRDCDSLVAFWDGKSRGTANTIELARKAGKPVHVFEP